MATTARGAPATIQMVADHAGVSRQTVSNALNAPERLSPDTLERVLASIDELGYLPNRSAQSLRTDHSRLYGMRIEPAPDGTVGPLLDRFLRALVSEAGAQNQHVLLFGPTDLDDDRSGYDELLRSRAVDAFVLANTHREDARLAFLQERKVPFVAFGRPWDDGASHGWVDVDGAAGTRLATHHLVEQGYERIGFLGWPADSETGNDRLAGWRDALSEHGREAGDGALARSRDNTESASRAVGPLLDAGHDAIVCASDSLATGVYRAVAERGLQVGRDVGVVGFDDSPTAALLQPSLTSVSQPVEQVAHHIVRLLGDLMAGQPAQDGVLLDPSLVGRQSSTRRDTPRKETQ